MNRGAQLARIGTFHTQDPVALAKELALLEGGLVAHLRDRATGAFGPLVRTAKQTSAYTAQPWQIVRVDPTAGAISVVLPQVTALGVLGSWIAVKNASASTNVITVSAIGSTIDGAASFAMSTARQFQWFYAADDEWERGPS